MKFTPATAIRFRSPFLANAFQSAHQGPQRILINPSTEQPIPVAVHEGTPETIHEAVSDAQRALQGEWTHAWTSADRRDALYTMATELHAHVDEIAYLESVSGGKPLMEAKEDVKSAVDVLKYFSGFADKLHGRTGQLSSHLHTFTLRQPVGVCGIITSYNYPLVLAMWKVAPALACGNAVILKPHERTPLSALFLGHIMQGKLPHGVMSIVPGGMEVGRALTEHHGVDKISFTGSGTVGRHVMMAAAKSNFKRVTLELGGKSPAIVFEDARVEQAVEDVFGAIFANMGQNCCAGSRLFLHRRIHDRFLELFKARLQRVRIGDATNEAFDFGPIVDKQQFDKIMKAVQEAKERGLNVYHGGRRYGDQGYFMEPTVFTGVQDTDPLACEEIFGPVLAVMQPFDSEEEAIRRANATPFGLASGIWTQNLDCMHRVTHRLRAGITWINCYNHTHPSMPFGGVKESGFGYDLGEEAVLQEYTVSRSIYMNIKQG